MIDRVNLYKNIELDSNKFSLKLKKYYDKEIDILTGEVIENISLYMYMMNGVKFLYVVKSKKLIVQGRLIMLLRNANHVYNLDDVYIQKEEIRYKVNSKLRELFNCDIDILDFNVATVEINFNIFNVNASLYIELFNKIVEDRQDNRYISYTHENNLPTNTSVYLKSKYNYDNNINKTYAINFYNKYNQLCNLKKKAEELQGNKINITDNDLELAKNVLRLEIKCANYEIRKYSRTFKAYFEDIYLCRDIVLTKYKRFICNTRLDFYNYYEAKDIITKTNKLKRNSKKKLLQYLELRYAKKKKYSKEELKKYFKMLELLNIAPAIIPTRYDVKKLESPIKLLDNKLFDLKDVHR
ncbi:hypothetical protein [Clostridioides sp. ES-S-0048-02]|uniref:hypothetical protein n=1 Tax=Clostridioides sp. ES-S-0048-02 TaxID=2770777 RepID=UPI001D105B27|nr:hypothetical protein [Clostridioides sp. ES-S-0048-02]